MDRRRGAPRSRSHRTGPRRIARSTSRSARRARAMEREWFDLHVDVFVGGEREPLTRSELDTLLSTNGRFAEVRGRLVDVDRLRQRRSLLSDLAERRRSGFAALLALRDELHENFGARRAAARESSVCASGCATSRGSSRSSRPSSTTARCAPIRSAGSTFLCYLVVVPLRRDSRRRDGTRQDDPVDQLTCCGARAMRGRRRRSSSRRRRSPTPGRTRSRASRPSCATLRLHSGSERAATLRGARAAPTSSSRPTRWRARCASSWRSTTSAR